MLSHTECWLVSFSNDKKVNFHTYQFKEKIFRTVVQQSDKSAVPIFFVDLEPSSNNKVVYKIKTNIVPPKKTKEFGHTKTYCRKTMSCVRCGLDHLTADSTKDVHTFPRCVNCLPNYPTIYRGCVVKAKSSKSLFNRRNNVIYSNNIYEFSQSNNSHF